MTQRRITILTTEYLIDLEMVDLHRLFLKTRHSVRVGRQKALDFLDACDVEEFNCMCEDSVTWMNDAEAFILGTLAHGSHTNVANLARFAGTFMLERYLEQMVLEFKRRRVEVPND